MNVQPNTPVQSDVEQSVLIGEFLAEYGSSYVRVNEHGYEAAKTALQQIIAQAVTKAELKLVSQITTDKGDAYYQSIPLYHFREQLRAALQAQQQGKE